MEQLGAALDATKVAQKLEWWLMILEFFVPH